MSHRILVWDVPTRVFHWLLVLSFIGVFLTAESERMRDIHVLFGYNLLALLAFRMLWGFIGTRYARFGSFLFRPGEIAAYLKSLVNRNPAHFIGHNPAGSVAIWLLLILGFASSVSGVMVFEDMGGDMLEDIHDFVSYAMLAVVVVHVLGVLLSSVLHRENLVLSMITGLKSDGRHDGVKRSYAWLGVIMLAYVVAFWFGFPSAVQASSGAGVAHIEQHNDD